MHSSLVPLLWTGIKRKVKCLKIVLCQKAREQTTDDSSERSSLKSNGFDDDERLPSKRKYLVLLIFGRILPLNIFCVDLELPTKHCIIER